METWTRLPSIPHELCCGEEVPRVSVCAQRVDVTCVVEQLGPLAARPAVPGAGELLQHLEGGVSFTVFGQQGGEVADDRRVVVAGFVPQHGDGGVEVAASNQ
ncbi:MAG: hypothetical protein ACRDRH_15550 [Pseudonocardia sp.]